MTLLLMIVLPLLGAALPLLTERLGHNWLGGNRLGRNRLGRNRYAVAAAVAPFAVLVMLLHHLSAVLAGNVLRYHLPWLSELGLDLSLRLDGLSMMFGLLISGIGLLVILYARYYLSDRDSLGKLYSVL